MEKITSRENAKIKYACRLASSGAFRRSEGKFLAEGRKLCPELCRGAALEPVMSYCIRLPADLDPQHKGPRQRGAHEPCQHPGGQQRHGVSRQLPRMGERCFKAVRRPHCGPQHHSQQCKQRPRHAEYQRPQPASHTHHPVIHLAT